MSRLFTSPFDALFNLQRALDASRTSDFLSRGFSGSGSYPPVNVFTQGDDFVVVTELPGLQRDEVDIQIKGNHVRIAGRKQIGYGQGASLHRRERIAGDFDRTISIPFEVDADHVRAEYRDGVLALFLPRAEQDKPRSITIN